MADIVRAQEASASEFGYAYHVFLSFRGTDTRKTFTDHLYNALLHAGFRTFRDDDEIQRGEEVRSELHGAIRQSRVSIVVFSRDYASSTWCLDELVAILEHRATSNHLVLPVFYGVDPSEVRKQEARVADAFAEHHAHPKSHQWRTALTQAAHLAGFTNDGLEAELIQKIVRVIEDKLRQTPLSVEPHLVGINSRADEINMWLQDGSTNVGITLICGIGGIGKTTIAKYIYNSNFQKFEAATFLSNVREISRQPNGLICLQRQLISNIVREKYEKIRSVDEGIIKIKSAISCRRVLLVLDDIDQNDQLLEAIIGMRSWFYPGSKIIITSMEQRLPRANELYEVHKVKILNDEESLNLFSWHAFGQDHPIEAYMGHSKEIVRYCGGLPLALKVLGRSLSGRSVDVWENALMKLRVILDNDILEKLKISYDSLQDDHDQSIFLHIACFFVGKDKDLVIEILDKCDLYTTIGIQNLIDRCLLSMDENNKIVMHQLIQNMGREIVRRESPDECGKRSRLWRHTDSFNVLKEKMGTMTIQGLVLNMDMLINEDRCSPTSLKINNVKRSRFLKLVNESEESISQKRRHFAFLSRDPINSISNNSKVEVEIDAFSMMKGLKLLELNSIQVIGSSYKEFPKRLRWLCWQGFPLNSIPTDFSMDLLVALEMPYSNLKQVWRESKTLAMLKFLNLSYSCNLVKTPDFLEIPNLKKLNLEGCKSLAKVDESIGDLTRLVLVNLRDCKNLRGLPKSIGKLEGLESLTISGCSSLKGACMELRSMKSLRVFEADGTDVGGLFSGSIGEVRSPGHALMWWSKPRRSIAPEISWPSLERLSVVGCNLSSEDFPRELSNLRKLRQLDLSRNPIVCLPECFRGLYRLKYLNLAYCTKLRSIVGPLELCALWILGCMSLEQTISIGVHRSYSCNHLSDDSMFECVNRYKLQPISKLDVEMVKYLGLDLLHLKSMENVELQTVDRTGRVCGAEKHLIKGIYEFGIFSICLPGNQISMCLSNQAKGSSISFTVPSNFNSKIIGLNVCSIFTRSSTLEPPEVNFYEACSSLFTKIRNKSKGGNTWIYGPSYHSTPAEDGGHMTWLSHWKFGDELTAGDEVNVCIIVGDSFRVVECGIKIVYEQEDDDEAAKGYNPFAGWTNVIGGDLSGRKHKGAYFIGKTWGIQFLEKQSFEQLAEGTEMESDERCRYSYPDIEER